MTITTGSFPRALEPGVFEFWGRKVNEHPTQYTDLFDVKRSEKNYETMVEATGFGLATSKGQGQPTTYEDETQGTVTKSVHVSYSKGFIVTREEIDDNLYQEVAEGRAEALAFSMRQTKEQVAANVYNNAFDSTYTFGDGKELLATDHPSYVGNQSNELATPADLSEASLEDLCIQIRKAENTKGLKINLQPRALIVSPDNEFEAHRILKSTLQNDTGNNAINALRASGMLPEGIKVNQYLTDEDAFFVRTNAPAGLTCFDRTPLEFSRDNDFDTENMKYKAFERYSFTVGDFRALYGSAGA